MSNHTGGFVSASKPKFSIWRLLGFGTAARPAEPELMDGLFVPSGLNINFLVDLGFADRLRVLVGGKVFIAALVKTSVVVEQAYTVTNTSVAAPNFSL